MTCLNLSLRRRLRSLQDPRVDNSYRKVHYWTDNCNTTSGPNNNPIFDRAADSRDLLQQSTAMCSLEANFLRGMHPGTQLQGLNGAAASCTLHSTLAGGILNREVG